jgi:chromate transporter
MRSVMRDYTPSIREIFTMFLTIGSTSFGGATPWAQHYLVEKRQWMTARGFTDMLTICQTAPGPNIVNLAVYFGYKNRGVLGCIAALIGLLAIPFFVTIALATIARSFLDTPEFKSALMGMTCAAVGFMFATAIKIAKPFSKNAIAVAVYLGTIALGVLFKLGLPLTLLIAGVAAIALAAKGKV